MAWHDTQWCSETWGRPGASSRSEASTKTPMSLLTPSTSNTSVSRLPPTLLLTPWTPQSPAGTQTERSAQLAQGESKWTDEENGSSFSRLPRWWWASPRWVGRNKEIIMYVQVASPIGLYTVVTKLDWKHACQQSAAAVQLLLLKRPMMVHVEIRSYTRSTKSLEIDNVGE